LRRKPRYDRDHVNLSTTPEHRVRYAAGMSRDGVNTVGLVVLCQVAHFLTFAAIPLLLPAIREDLGINFTQAGMLSAAASLSYAAGQIPSGLLSDRFGPRRLYLIGLLAWSVLSVSFGLIHAFWLALVNLFVAGAFRALLFAPGLSLLASWFPPQRRATAMSLFLLGGAGGSILLSLAGPFLAERYGWRATFILFAILGLGVACLYGAYAKEKPRLQKRKPISVSDVLEMARFPILWVCGWLQFVRFAVSDRLRNPPLVIGSALGVLACAAALLPVVQSMPMLLLVVAVYSIFLGFYFGPLFIVPVEVLGSRVAGTTIGFANLFANIGGFVCVYTLGAVRDLAGSFAWGFYGISSACVTGVVLAAVLARMRTHALMARSREST
jgi:sugar phosphate permease